MLNLIKQKITENEETKFKKNIKKIFETQPKNGFPITKTCSQLYFHSVLKAL